MTGEELTRGNELKEEMQKLCDQTYILQKCLCAEKSCQRGKYKKFLQQLLWIIVYLER